VLNSKAEFSALLQSSVSHELSEIFLICWFGAQETTIKNTGNHKAFFMIIW